MELLILYGSTEGQSEKIAYFLQREAQLYHLRATVSDVVSAPSLQNYGAVIVVASIHAGQYKNEIVEYVTANSEELSDLAGVFYSVGLTIVSKDQHAIAQLHEMTALFLEMTKWKPMVVEQIGGALRYSKYGFFKKILVRSIIKKAGGDTDTCRDYEYTDWEALRMSFEHFVGKFEGQLV